MGCYVVGGGYILSIFFFVPSGQTDKVYVFCDSCCISEARIVFSVQKLLYYLFKVRRKKSKKAIVGNRKTV